MDEDTLLDATALVSAGGSKSRADLDCDEVTRGQKSNGTGAYSLEDSGSTRLQPNLSAATQLTNSARLLKNRFALLDLLGAGGMGEVYLARDLLREEMGDHASNIAIKVLNENSRQLPGALQALQREAKRARSLSHPNIVTVFDFDRDGDTAFITMEYIEGQSLRQHLRTVLRMEPRRALYVIERVARGLAYAHQQGYVHADIKPANIFLGHEGSVKILDFGIAKAFKEAESDHQSLADTLTEGAMTPAYASPQMLGGAKVKPADDVYALACMAYEMLAGHHPFCDATGRPLPADEACKQHRKPQVIAGVPRRTMRAVCRGLSFTERARFANAGEFIDAIKTRSWKKQTAVLALTVVVTAFVLFSASEVQQNIVPETTALKPELKQVAQLIDEGDALMALGDIDMAHRLYSQAWELTSDLTAADPPEREKAQSIIRDRTEMLSDGLIARSQLPEADEFALRELYVALDFLSKDDIPGNDEPIARALADIDNRLQQTGFKSP